MRLIDNLEELKVGDYILRSFNIRIKDIIIFEVKVSTKDLLQVKGIKYYRKDWDESRQWITCRGDKLTTIPKKIRKTKKKKLKHKLQTYNNEWVIFKLTKEEKGRTIKEMILKKLE